jgi:uncharacterized membrane protein YqjE
MPDDRMRFAVPPAPAGVFDRLSKTVHDAGRLVVDHLELAALEAQRAADGLVQILIASMVVTILVVAAWMAMVAGGAIWATRSGMSLPWALVLAGGLNLVAALAVGMWIRARVPHLMFTATLRQLRNGKGADTDEDSDEIERHA